MFITFAVNLLRRWKVRRQFRDLVLLSAAPTVTCHHMTRMTAACPTRQWRLVSPTDASVAPVWVTRWRLLLVSAAEAAVRHSWQVITEILHTCHSWQVITEILHTCHSWQVITEILHTCHSWQVITEILHTCHSWQVITEILHTSQLAGNNWNIAHV